MKKNRIIALGAVVIVLAVCIILVFIKFNPVGAGNNKSSSSEPAAKDRLVQYFKTTHPGKKILTTLEGAVESDGTKGLIVVYNVGKNKNMMTVVVDKSNKLQVSDEVPAPDLNPKLQFKLYGNETTSDFILSGSDSTGSIFGYAIFQLNNMKIVDIFDEGMDQCCD